MGNVKQIEGRSARGKENRPTTDKQQRQAKMPAAGATQALRLCRDPLLSICLAKGLMGVLEERGRPGR